MVECSDGTLYTGWTTDPKRRVKEHNAGRGARYTRVRRPVRLVYLEEVTDHSSALQREHTIKGFSRRRKQALIQTQPDEPTADPHREDEHV